MEEESSCSRNMEEVLGAAQQLMQLSNEDDSSSNVVTAEKKKNNKKRGGGDGGEEEVDQKRCQIEASIWSKIEEIFGKEEEKLEEDRNSICRPKKRRSRFRSIQSIYMTTKPIINARFSGNRIIPTLTPS